MDLCGGNSTAEEGSGASSSGGLFEVPPSIPLCIGLSAFGGMLEVSSTMCLAYPEHKSKLGKVYSKCQQRLHLVANLLLMAVASVTYIVGSWFGPVSLSVPTVMVSKLMWRPESKGSAAARAARGPWLRPEERAVCTQPATNGHRPRQRPQLASQV